MPFPRRTAWIVVAALVAVSSVADARGGGGMGGGGGRRGGAKKGKKADAQVEQLIHDAYRRDAVTRSRYGAW